VYVQGSRSLPRRVEGSFALVFQLAMSPFWVRFGCAPLPVPWTTELGALAGHIALSLSGARPQHAQSGQSRGIWAAHSV
jgi:hypothetical protein